MSQTHDPYVINCVMPGQRIQSVAPFSNAIYIYLYLLIHVTKRGYVEYPSHSEITLIFIVFKTLNCIKYMLIYDELNLR